MSKDRLILSTKTSVYDPIEIEIEGRLYQSRRLTRPLQIELDAIEKRLSAGEGDAIFEQAKLIFSIPEKILDELDKREVEDIIVFFQEKIQTIEQKRLKKAVEILEKTLGQKGIAKKVIPKNRKRPGSNE